MSTERPLTLLHAFPIRAGSHARRGDGMCAMEMVAWLAGEEHSDGPGCACPVVAAVVRAFNDALPGDAARSFWLRTRIPRLVNSRAGVHDERARGFLVADYAVRVFGAQALAARGAVEAARRIERLPAVLDHAAALLASGALKQLGAPVAAAAWIAGRAAGTLPAKVWVAPVVQQARLVGGDASWELLALLTDQLLETATPAEAVPVQGFAELG